MSAMIPPDIVQDGVAYWKADKVSAYFGGSPTVGTLGVWRYRGEGPKFVKLGGKREHRKTRYPPRRLPGQGGDRLGRTERAPAADSGRIEMWCPITDEGMSWPPADLIEEFWDRICDRNSQTANPYIYLLPYAEQVDVDRQNRKVSALVECASKADYRGGKPN